MISLRNVMTISIFIDGSAWNVLCNQEIDLNAELPPDKFSIFSTNEVNIEIDATPDAGKDGVSKIKYKRYIAKAFEDRQIPPDSPFGFNTGPGPQRFSPFNQGTFQSDQHREWYARPENKKYGKVNPATGLAKHEADASLAVHAFESIILTNDKEPGPLKRSIKEGGKVVLLSTFERKSISLWDYISAALK